MDPGVIRPPWALRGGGFEARCTGCGDCVRACDEKIIDMGRDRLPAVDFRSGGCTFCGACVRACKPAALGFQADAEPPWQVRARVGNACLALRAVVCRICKEHCDADAISVRLATGGRALVAIDPETCTGCGACHAPCPVDAIEIVRRDAPVTATGGIA